jgi:hypothetical protein
LSKNGKAVIQSIATMTLGPGKRDFGEFADNMTLEHNKAKRIDAYARPQLKGQLVHRIADTSSTKSTTREGPSAPDERLIHVGWEFEERLKQVDKEQADQLQEYRREMSGWKSG